MADEGSYEIMPYKEIVELKKQIADLQHRAGDTSSKELLESMAALTKSMDNMLHLFSSAAEEMKLEEKTEGELAEKIAPLIEKVDKLDEQNKTIAEGLVAVAGMIKDIKGEKKEMHKPAPPKHESFGGLPPLDEELPPLGPPPTEGPGPMGGPPPMGGPRVVLKGPMPSMGGPPGPPGMPPMPPSEGPPGMGPLPPLPPLEEEPKKKGLAGLFKKK